MSDEKTEDSVPVVISYSMGSSSETMVRLVIAGEIERPEHLAVACSDTGDEHDWSYEAREEVRAACAVAGIPFLDCQDDRETLSEHLIKIPSMTRADQPPFYIAKDGGGRGRVASRCTDRFKIAPMRRVVSGWLESIGKPKRVVKWLGFGPDEYTRALKATKMQDVQWERLDFPLMRLGWRREQQRAWLAKTTGRAPMFSMCVECPHKGPDRWKATPAAQLAKAYAVDEAVRDPSSIGFTDGDGYLSDRLISIERLIKHGDPSPSLPGLEAYCDGGACFL